MVFQRYWSIAIKKLALQEQPHPTLLESHTRGSNRAPKDLNHKHTNWCQIFKKNMHHYELQLIIIATVVYSHHDCCFMSTKYYKGIDNYVTWISFQSMTGKFTGRFNNMLSNLPVKTGRFDNTFRNLIISNLIDQFNLVMVAVS